jgi:hypothetical protein
MTHTQDDEFRAKMQELDMRDGVAVAQFCKDCYQPLMMTDRFSKFALDGFAASLPTVDEYMSAGDYTGASAKIGLGIFAAMINDGVLAELTAPIAGMSVLQEVPILKDADSDFVANTLAMTVARVISHVAICENHDIGNPYAFFGEMRYTFAQVLFYASDKYLEIAKNLVLLMLGAMAQKGDGYIEKNPVLTYHLNRIEEALDSSPIPATQLGMQASTAFESVKESKGVSYPSYASGLLALSMIFIQYGVVDLDTAKAINESVINYVEALQEAA